jgi:hypothetical protein
MPTCSNIEHSAQQCSQLVHHGNQASANLSFSNASAVNPVTWFPDTGANQHVTPDIAGMTHADPYLGNDQLYVGDGKGLIISNTTHKIMHTPKRTFTVSNIIHVPKIKKRLLSVQQFCRENCVFLSFTLLFSLSGILSEPIFGLFPNSHFFFSIKKIQKNKKYYQKNITVKRGCYSALKMIKNWLRRFKITKIRI